ncbi:unnamed protein product [Mycena citricolor]|uniref:TauD/TfdA-like domain-containing protein n=1 Tax=Mycena citricolor TaxID=2018698 RepID=A0AAD2HNH4_9AGAR|nr:unnamed protein product [Mycena citricolor]
MVAAPFSPLGSLSVYESFDETPHIGTRFPNKAVQLSQILRAPNSDELVKDLATLVSYRGVVFFSDQDLTIDEQKALGQRLGQLAGKPPTSTLHVHPISEDTPELTKDVSVISSEGGIARSGYSSTVRASNGWHTDITFEPVPSDYAILKLHTVPSGALSTRDPVFETNRSEVGGDTLVRILCDSPSRQSAIERTITTSTSGQGHGYEAYDKLSPAYQKFLEGLTALHDGAGFKRYAERVGRPINEPRGSPENIGTELKAVHPVIRTHPVTGWKTLFVNKSFTKRIVELHEEESDTTLEYLRRHVSENHDMQVRFKWKKNDIAIWDNRCTFHTATNDFAGVRTGNRVVSIGEKPFFDPASKSRRATLDL